VLLPPSRAARLDALWLVEVGAEMGRRRRKRKRKKNARDGRR
jgi:hypothetical protein